MKLSDIKNNPNNPRLIKDDRFHKLVKSIEEFPKMMSLRPMVVDNNNMILGGNMRLKALQHLGFKEISGDWVMKASELTEEEQKRFIISDNAGFGEHDWEVLANDWDSEKLEEWGIEIPVYIDEGIEDIEDAEGFNESVNFTIKCESIKQLEELQTKLSCDTVKLNYADFLIKVGL